MPSATNVLEYAKLAEKLDALRVSVKAAGIKRIARMSGVPRSKLQAFVNQGVDAACLHNRKDRGCPRTSQRVALRRDRSGADRGAWLVVVGDPSLVARNSAAKAERLTLLIR